jgi:3-hydroxy acid dehydrogenase/malonic semialdehyde reductase
MTTAMGKRLKGKTIVITGASSGIGRSTAMEFARTSPKNLKLVLTARRLDTLKQVAEDIKKEVGDGVKVLPVKLDVSKAAEIKAFVDGLPAEFKEIDVLVNNALVFSPVMDMTHGTDSVIHCQRTRKRSGESA